MAVCSPPCSAATESTAVHCSAPPAPLASTPRSPRELYRQPGQANLTLSWPKFARLGCDAELKLRQEKQGPTMPRWPTAMDVLAKMAKLGSTARRQSEPESQDDPPRRPTTPVVLAILASLDARVAIMPGTGSRKRSQGGQLRVSSWPSWPASPPALADGPDGMVLLLLNLKYVRRRRRSHRLHQGSGFAALHLTRAPTRRLGGMWGGLPGRRWPAGEEGRPTTNARLILSRAQYMSFPADLPAVTAPRHAGGVSQSLPQKRAYSAGRPCAARGLNLRWSAG